MLRQPAWGGVWPDDVWTQLTDLESLKAPGKDPSEGKKTRKSFSYLGERRHFKDLEFQVNRKFILTQNTHIYTVYRYIYTYICEIDRASARMKGNK